MGARLEDIKQILGDEVREVNGRLDDINFDYSVRRILEEIENHRYLSELPNLQEYLENTSEQNK